MIDTRSVAAAVAALVLGVSCAHAGDRVSIDELLPEPGLRGFVGDALYPDMGEAGDGAAAGPVPAYRDAAVPLPFTPHFGLSTGRNGGTAQVDGIYYSPADGVELTAKPGISNGLQGTLGLTFRF